ncbi:DUF6153 family protein [Actinoallomurus soli]|uniref:DUF6153 family protein n=1 Tax=Actinoallomurus soli TaxID=2952535 RepID=UPI00209317A1|nr:DUF6153 family protein [Actinoallomurus soli]MCO5968469.1 DUF6153 family protein [Actinoallomurus soli]
MSPNGLGSGHHRAGAPAPSPGGLLLLALTLLGLFAMHGLQATTGPTDTHASAIVAMSGMADTDAGMHHADAGAGRHRVSPPSHVPAGHRHPGGQMCLGLLVMATLLLLAAAFAGRRDVADGTIRPIGRGRDSLGRAPPRPSIFRLCVLRR